MGHSWADDVIVRLWPQDKGASAEALDLIPLPFASQRVADHIADSLAEAGPTLGVRNNYSFAHQITRVRRDEKIDYARFRRMNFANFLMSDKQSGQKQCAILKSAHPTAFAARYISVDSAELYARFDEPEFSSASWSAIQSV
jgi:hypothetical protein